MSDRANKLARALADGPQVSPAPPAPPPMRWTRGVIVSTPTSTTATVHVDGDTTVAVPASRPSWSGTLSAGTNVEVLISGSRALIIG